MAVIDRWGLWLDEIYTVGFRGTASLETVLFVPYDPHPPLYFLLVKGWTAVFGTSPTTVRMLSLLFSVAAVAGMYSFGEELYDKWTGVVAALLLAIGPVHIHFGRIARMYSLVVLLTVSSCYFYVRLHERKPWITILYILTSAGLLYSHVYGVFVIVGQALHYLWEEWNIDTTRWTHGVVIYGIIGLLYLPWGLVLGSQVVDLLVHQNNPTTSVSWIPAPSIRLVLDMAEIFVGKPWLYPISAGNALTSNIVQAMILLFSIAAAGGLVRSNPNRWAKNYKIFVAFVFLAPIVLPLVISIVVTPIYYPRFTLPATVPLVVLVASGIRSVPFNKVTYIAVIIVVSSSLVLGTAYYQGETVEPWQESVGFLQEQTDRDDLIVVQPAYALGEAGFFDYYYVEDAVLIGTDPGAPTLEQSEQNGLNTTLQNGDSVCVFQYSSTTDIGKDRLFGQHQMEEFSSYAKGKITVSCFTST
jgi:uncharacterized membrane protein